jgi:hypothetical protein
MAREAVVTGFTLSSSPWTHTPRQYIAQKLAGERKPEEVSTAQGAARRPCETMIAPPNLGAIDSPQRSHKEFPKVEVRFLVTRWGIQTLVEDCIFCGRQHRHGGSALDGNPFDAFLDNERGGTIAHCKDGGGIYTFRLAPRSPVVFEDGRAKTRKMVKRMEALDLEIAPYFLFPARKRRRRHGW